MSCGHLFHSLSEPAASVRSVPSFPLILEAKLCALAIGGYVSRLRAQDAIKRNEHRWGIM
jgi:hypothetical protein